MEKHSYIHTYTHTQTACIRRFIRALFVLIENWKPHKYSPAEEWFVVIFSHDEILIAVKMNKPPNTKQQSKLKKFPTYDNIYFTFKNLQTISHVA